MRENLISGRATNWKFANVFLFLQLSWRFIDFWKILQYYANLNVMLNRLQASDTLWTLDCVLKSIQTALQGAVLLNSKLSIIDFYTPLFIYYETKIISNGNFVSLTSGWEGGDGGGVRSELSGSQILEPSQNLRLVNHPRTAVAWVSLSSLKQKWKECGKGLISFAKINHNNDWEILM